MPRAAALLGAAFLFLWAGVTVALRLLRPSRHAWTRVAVEGHSMEPTLWSGDWLLVDPLAYRVIPPVEGDLVVTCDPRAADRWIIKRVAALLPDGRLALCGDHPAHRSEDTALASVHAALVMGRPRLRYWPPRRWGRVS